MKGGWSNVLKDVEAISPSLGVVTMKVSAASSNQGLLTPKQRG